MSDKIRDERIDMTIELSGLTVAQAIAMKDMFDMMRKLGSLGSSRFVGYYSDGDGNFRPKPKYTFSAYSNEIEEWADPRNVDPLDNGNESWGNWKNDMYLVDFDPIAWRLHYFEENPDA